MCFAPEILKHEAEALFSLGLGTKRHRESDHSGRNGSNGADAADRRESHGIAIVADMNVQQPRLVVVISSTVENETALNCWATSNRVDFVFV